MNFVVSVAHVVTLARLRNIVHLLRNPAILRPLTLRQRSTMKIHQRYTHNQLRNFNYILELDDKRALVIDPWDPNEINEFLDMNHLSLYAIINTHEHWDHTQGNQALVDQHSCEVWAHKNGEGKIPALSRSLSAGEIINLNDKDQLLVLDTPGHTFAHCCFMVKENNVSKAIFTGDTLFNAGVGHCKGGGDEKVLYQTIIEQFHILDDSVIVYPGHDYLENNLRFTLKYEPTNSAASAWLKKVANSSYWPGIIQTTIKDEKSFNTFFRLNNAEIINNLSLDKPDDEQVFLALRARRDNW